MSRVKTTGRFHSRAELVERVRFLYYETDLTMSAVARNCGISFGTADTIIESREWETLQGEDFEENGPDPRSIAVPLGPSIPLVHEESCGSGFMPTSCPCHLPAQILYELEMQE